MDYRIREKDDINEGSILTIRIPEELLDRNALLTMEEDRPPFVIPFTYRNVDGETEISYKLGNWSRLRYYGGEKTVAEYCELFRKILLPLQKCDDWFMNPFCFLLSVDHVYYQADNQSVAYIYIPAKEPCSDKAQLVAMVKQLNKQFPASSSDFKVKVLESLEDFRIKTFLDMLKEEIKPVEEVELIREEKADERNSAKEDVNHGEESAEEEQVKDLDEQLSDLENNDDLVIHWGGKKTPPKEKKQPQEKKRDKNGVLGSLFGKKKTSGSDEAARQSKKIVRGAGGEDDLLQWESGEEDNRADHAEEYDEKTQIMTKTAGRTRLICVGDRSLPEEIEILATEDKVFKIGRFDISVGRKQSDFEFDKNTKEVSRHHAVIEFRNGEYYIVDLNSSAGTMLDGKRIPANKAHLLQEGMKISFGSAGADYVFRK